MEYIIHQHPSSNTETLYRKSDGMRIGVQQNITVIFGEDPNKCVGRAFISIDAARAYLRTLAEADATFEVVNLESVLSMPGDIAALPGHNSIRRF